MPMVLEKFDYSLLNFIRDARPFMMRMADTLNNGQTAGTVFAAIIAGLLLTEFLGAFSDVFIVFALLYIYWMMKQPFKLTFKLPAHSGLHDPNYLTPGGGPPKLADGILFVGNDMERGNKELWFTNDDARTHLMFLGTTGSGKTEGLKSLVSNSLMWGSGFIFIDGKADTDLWASLYSLTRRFGRDDDILVLNYMTGNTDVFDDYSSNSFNPFAFGSASFLANLVISLMPEAGGDNAMWKERAVSLMFSLMPALTWKRDHEDLLLDVGVVREYLELRPIIKLSRSPNMPERIIRSLQMYLLTLPGYVEEAFDNDGNEKPPSPDAPMYDMQVARQQHGYLSMQFTRAMQSLADEYGYIFKKQLADVDVIDVVLNRRIMVVLIPALEKSGDEAANLGKIVAASLKGMMGATLGANIEGTWEMTIENKMTRAPSPYMTVFDEVGYYAQPGMGVMAAQARSLGFSMIFAAQDMPAIKKRIKEEALSIAGNCNIKIFGKLEDPTETKEYWQKLIGDTWVVETKGQKRDTNSLSMSYMDENSSGHNMRPRATFDHLKRQKAGQVHIHFAYILAVTQLFHADIRPVDALRVQKLLPVPESLPAVATREKGILEVAGRLLDEEFSMQAAGAPEVSADIAALSHFFEAAQKPGVHAAKGFDGVRASMAAVAALAKQQAESAADVPAAVAPTALGAGLLGKAPKTQHPFGQDDAVFAFTPGAVDMPADLSSAAPPSLDSAASALMPNAMSASSASPISAREAEVKPKGEAPMAGDLTLPPELAALMQQAAENIKVSLLASRQGGGAAEE